jgi:hypothetical protein
MKKFALLTVLMGLGLALFSGCASMQTRLGYERSAETKMIVIQEKIADGVKTGALAPDQSRMYQATLKDIQADYAGFRGKSVSTEERNSLQGRLDVLGDVVYRALNPAKKNEAPKDSFWERLGRDMGVLPSTGKTKEPTMGDRIITIQKKIDDGRSSGAFSLKQGNDFQAVLDYARREYLRMLDGVRPATIEESAAVSRLLDSLESDLNHLPRL